METTVKPELEEPTPTTAPSDDLADPLGSVQVVGSSGSKEEARESATGGHFTQRLISLMEGDGDLDSALHTIVDETLEGGQHPTQVQISAPSGGESQSRKAAVIGNSRYQPQTSYHNLTADKDARSMTAALKSEGYEVPGGPRQNLGAAALEKALKKPLADKSLSAGDDVVLYYAGHGKRSGLVGTDGEIAPNAVLDDAAGEARKLGLDLRIILDACYSGSAADTVRTEYLNLKSDTDLSAEQRQLVSAAQELDRLKQEVALRMSELTTSIISETPTFRSEPFGSPPDVETVAIKAFRENFLPGILKAMKAFTDRFAITLTAPGEGLKHFDRNIIVDSIDDILDEMIACIEGRRPRK
jgi:hypothetical protein